MPQVKIEHAKPMTLAYIEHVGRYDRIPFQRDIERLYGWAKENKIRPGFRPLGVFYDVPARTAETELRSEVAIPIYGEGRPADDVKVRDVPGMDVATISHKGPNREYPNTYRTLSEWISENGYEWAGPAIEVYTKKPEVKGKETILFAKIEAPVRKKKR